MVQIQGSAKRWSLGCVNPASLLRLAMGSEFMQPRAHLLADPCTEVYSYKNNTYSDSLTVTTELCSCTQS